PKDASLTLYSTLPLSRTSYTAAISKGKWRKWIEEVETIKMWCIFDVDLLFPIFSCCPRVGERPRR
ncbi:unnamed protein product, partial [Urochloa humidicola]